MMVSSSGNSFLWDSMKASSSCVMSSFRKMGWYCGMEVNCECARAPLRIQCRPCAIVSASAFQVARRIAQQQRRNDG